MRSEAIVCPEFTPYSQQSTPIGGCSREWGQGAQLVADQGVMV